MKRKPATETAVVPSRARVILYAVAAVICLAGLADATYLTVQALTGETTACGGSPDCFKVLGSSYSKILGMPVAALGMTGYFAAFSFATFSGFGSARAQKFFALTVWAMFAATLWFLYVQAFVLHAYCRYCLFSAALTFLLAGLVVATPPRRET